MKFEIKKRDIWVISVCSGCIFTLLCLFSRVNAEELKVSVNEEAQTENVEELDPSLNVAWGMEWPTVINSMDYLSERNYYSTYSGCNSYLYNVNLSVSPSGIVFEFPKDGIRSSEYDARLYYRFTQSENGYAYEASSTNAELLSEFMHLDKNTEALLMSGEHKQNRVLGNSGEIIQEMNYRDSRYYINETKTFNNNIKNDVFMQLAQAIESGSMFYDVGSYAALTDVELSYISAIVNKLRNKTLNMNISLNIMPLEGINDSDLLDDRSFRIYDMDFKETLSDNVYVRLHLDGYDKYNVHRDFYYMIGTTGSVNALKTQQIADLLGLQFNELGSLLDNKEKYVKSDEDKLSYYNYYEGEVNKDVIGVIKVHWNKGKLEVYREDEVSVE